MRVVFTKKFNAFFEEEGLKVITYRDVPVDTSVLADHVAETMPAIQQVFVENKTTNILIVRYLLLVNKLNVMVKSNLDLYFASLSRRTIVYKGWLRSDQIKGYMSIY